MTVLDAWLYGVRVAVVRSTGAGRPLVEFTEAARERWGVGSSVVAAQMPLSAPAGPCRLPERRRLT